MQRNRYSKKKISNEAKCTSAKTDSLMSTLSNKQAANLQFDPNIEFPHSNTCYSDVKDDALILGGYRVASIWFGFR